MVCASMIPTNIFSLLASSFPDGVTNTARAVLKHSHETLLTHKMPATHCSTAHAASRPKRTQSLCAYVRSAGVRALRQQEQCCADGYDAGGGSTVFGAADGTSSS
jgi:hypothetical protein